MTRLHLSKAVSSISQFFGRQILHSFRQSLKASAIISVQVFRTMTADVPIPSYAFSSVTVTSEGTMSFKEPKAVFSYALITFGDNFTGDKRNINASFFSRK